MNFGNLDWCFEFDPPSTEKNNGQGHDLVELLWQNGQVVLHCQNNRKPSPNRSDARQQYSHNDPVAKAGVASSGIVCNPIPDDEMVSWIHYPVEESLEKEFSSQFFGELPSMDIHKPVNSGPFSGNMRTATVPDISGGQMPPPRFHFHDNSPGGSGEVVNFAQFSQTLKGETGGRRGIGVLSQVDVRDCSAMTEGSSRCGSNQIPNDFPDQSHASGGFSVGLVKEDDCHVLSLSSGGSDRSFGATGKQCIDERIGRKRKGREGEETKCGSEALEIESAGGKKSGGSTRSSRAAQVHNLSERRRRDRINKKMKALQELIPHCNKTDKSSMLDEAIEYLKSLQLQLQVMWMGGGMAPMMFPAAMGMTMSPPSPTMPSVPPNMNKGMFGQTPVMNPMIFQNQIANPSFPEQFARYMAMHGIQTPQPGNMFEPDCQGARQNQANSRGGTIGNFK